MATENGVLSGSFTATGNSDKISVYGNFTVAVHGTFVGTAQLQKYDSANNAWHVVDSGVFTEPGMRLGVEPEYGAVYRLACTAYTSGTILYRVAQGSNGLMA